MIEKIQLLWSYIIDEGIEFTRDLNIAGAIAILGLYVLSCLQWITIGAIPNILSLLGIVIIAVVVVRLVSISKAIGVTVLGEVAEIVGAVESRPGPDNKLLRLYYNIVVQILISLAIMIVLLPRIPMGNAWWLWMVWPTILLIFAVVLGSQDGKKIRAIGLIVFLMVVVYTVNTTWPNLWEKTTSLPHSIGDSFMSPEEKAELELTSQGWQKAAVIPYTAIINGVQQNIAGIHFPSMKGKKLIFKNFRWSCAYARDIHGRFRKVWGDYTVVSSIVKVGENDVVFLLPVDNRPPPNFIWWRPE